MIEEDAKETRDRGVEPAALGPSRPGAGKPVANRVEVVPWTAGSFRVRLWGRFPLGWAGSLSLGLSEAGISVERGFARRTGLRQWEAELQVRRKAAGPDANAVDYLALASSQRRAPTPAPIALQSYAIDRERLAAGTLQLEVRGRDRVGFLGGLLDRLAGLSLFPVEMRIETTDDIALDRFSLMALGGREPSEEVEKALVALLEDLVREGYRE